MGNVPSLTPKKLARILVKRGFVLIRVHGSHHYFLNSDSNRITVIPMHCKSLAKGTLYAILKQAGINKEEL